MLVDPIRDVIWYRPKNLWIRLIHLARLIEYYLRTKLNKVFASNFH